MTRQIENVYTTDAALVLGAGIAGLFTALKMAPHPSIVIAEGTPGSVGSSAIAQGGIAAAVRPDDTWQSHAHDTVNAGAGLTVPEIAELVAKEGPARIDDLAAMGAPFDRYADGSYSVSREAAHACARVVHVSGDRAGPEVTRTLAENAAAAPSVQVMRGFHAIALAMEDGRVVGLFCRTGHGSSARMVLFRSPKVVFAAGGLGSLFAVTTNPPEVRGEGLGMAARAGAVIGDPEFVQFHPTSIAGGRDPAWLATEALRGHGATLVNETGERYMTAVHELAELAPRDVVARANHRQIQAGHKIFLDAREAIGAHFAEAFPTVYGACKSYGIDPATDLIPVAPAAHYHMGGIATDRHGRSSLPGLWAVGECASTGLHGANRLASNSLLENLVFGARVAEDIQGQGEVKASKTLPQVPEDFELAPVPMALRKTMTSLVGLERNGETLTRAMGEIVKFEHASNFEPALMNSLATAKMVIAGAYARHESRGSHFRTDYPERDEVGRRTFMTLDQANVIFDQALAGTRANKAAE